jgi:hypothetical protein
VESRKREKAPGHQKWVELFVTGDESWSNRRRAESDRPGLVESNPLGLLFKVGRERVRSTPAVVPMAILLIEAKLDSRTGISLINFHRFLPQSQKYTQPQSRIRRRDLSLSMSRMRSTRLKSEIAWRPEELRLWLKFVLAVAVAS